MQDFTANRNAETPDELWLCEHFPVFTLGQAGKQEHWLRDIGVPLVKVDRGGQITYHGPGQVVIYLLLDLARRELKIPDLVYAIEQCVLDFLATQQLVGMRLAGAPGVYVEQHQQPTKIAALGLKVRKNGCYHGLSLNVDMDLSPFAAINPCGYAGMNVSQTRDLGVLLSSAQIADLLLDHLQNALHTHQLKTIKTPCKIIT